MFFLWGRNIVPTFVLKTSVITEIYLPLQFKNTTMNCHDFNADIIPIGKEIAEDLLQQIKELSKCGHCATCLYSYIMLAQNLSNEELKNIFGSDLLEDTGLIPTLNELAGLHSNPYPNRLRIARVNKALQKICIQKEKGNKALIKHYINECIRQYEGDMLEEYFNMAP